MMAMEGGMCLEKVKNASLKEKAYRMIRESISNCTLIPGTLINEKELIELIGVSRTPIREALSRLDQENLVRIVPQRGVFVTDLTLKNIENICDTRELVEPYFARIAALKADERDLKRYEDFFIHTQEFDFETEIRTDSDFHVYVASFSDNDYLLQMMNNIYTHNNRLRRLLCRIPSRLSAAPREHLDIIRAMLQRDAEGAAEAMKDHIINSRKTAFNMETN